MKTVEVKTAGINNNSASNKALENKANNTGNYTEKVNNLPVSTAFNADAKKEEAKKTEAPAPVKENEQAKATPQAGQGKPQEEQPKAEPQKEVKAEASPAKPILNLEGTLKLVEELHRRKIQRDRLLETIDTLEAFEVAQIDDADETDANHFQGCVLTIEDDNRRKFTTKNPVIIQAVAQFVNHMCVNRLSEIEAGITIPA